MSLRDLPLALSVLLTATSCVVSVPVATQEPYTDEARPVFTQGQGTRNPIIQSFTANPNNVTQGQAITFQVVAHDPDRQPLQFNWSATDGTLSTNTGQVVSWIPPARPGTYTVMVTVANGRGGFATGALNLTVQPDGSAKVGSPASPLPMPSLSPSVTSSPTSTPLASPTTEASAAPSPTASAVTTPRPNGAVVQSLPGGPNSHGFGLDAATGSNKAYFRSSHEVWSATFNSLSDVVFKKEVETSRNASGDLTVSDGQLYYENTDFGAFVMPDGKLIGLPLNLHKRCFEVVGNTAFITSSSSPCIYKFDLTTRSLSVLAGSETERSYVDGTGTNARFSNPNGLIYDPVSKTLLVADTANRRIRQVTLAGEVSTFSGNGANALTDGPKAEANFNGPLHLTRDDAGNLYIADYLYIRKIDAAGNVTTIAGNGKGTTVDGTGAEASFYYPRAIAYGKVGQTPVLFVSEPNRPIRIVHNW